MEALYKAIEHAFDGAMQKSIGSTSASAQDTIRANGVKLKFFTACSEAKIKAHPPSLILEALPAVIVPVFENTGFNVGILSF